MGQKNFTFNQTYMIVNSAEDIVAFGRDQDVFAFIATPVIYQYVGYMF